MSKYFKDILVFCFIFGSQVGPWPPLSRLESRYRHQLQQRQGPPRNIQCHTK